MHALWQDIRYGIRLLTKNPGFTIVAVLTLAFGIGANTAIFSVVNSVLLRPLAFRQPDQLYVIHEIVPQMSRFYPSLPANLTNFRIWRKECYSFEEIALAESSSLDLTGWGEAEEVHGIRGSANLLSLLGVRPAIGRSFLPQEDEPGHGHVVILTNRFWQGYFHADPTLVGKTVILDGAPYEVVGILPSSFDFPRQLGMIWQFPDQLDFLTPLNGPKPYETGLIGEFDYAAIARLKPVVTPEQALADLNVVQARIASEANEGVDLRADLVPLEGEIVGPARRGLIFLLAAVGAVLLIVCANLASLLLTRLPGRLREAAIRTALGATRLRLLCQMLVESLLLGILGGALGIWFASLGVQWLVQAGPVDLPRLSEVHMDGRVLWFAVLLSILTSILFGVVPALRVAQAEPQEALKSGGVATTESRRTRHLRQVLVGLEVGLSTLLLILAGLLTSSLAHLLRSNAGFSVEHELAVSISLPPQSYSQADARLRFYNQALDSLRTLPGVRAAGWVSHLPLDGEGQISGVTIPGLNQKALATPPASYRAASPDYIPAMGIPLIEGRQFTEADRGRKVVVISQSVASRFWPGKNPIGQTLITQWAGEYAAEVIGVLSDVRTVRLDQPAPMMVYVPDWYNSHSTPTSASFVVRTTADPDSVAAGARSAIHSVDPDVPIVALRSMAQVVSRSVESRRFQMSLVLTFALSALFLASLGIFGVVAYSVAQRQRELAIRMTLGAQAGDVRGLVLRTGLTPVTIGLASGIAAALVAGKLIRSLLFSVSVMDPLTIACVALVVVFAATMACYVPARKATRVDPMVALRYE